MLLSAPWVNNSNQVTNNNFYSHENQERKNQFQNKGFALPPPAYNKGLIKLEMVIELTSNIVPKPGMMKDEKGLVKRSCHDLIMTQSFEMRQKKLKNSLACVAGVERGRGYGGRKTGEHWGETCLSVS